MGLLDGGAAKARARQKQALLGEAASAGGTVAQVFEAGDEAKAASAAVFTTLKALVGGTVNSDSAQVFVVETRGLRHLYGQPYSGTSPMPGEHHAVVRGSVPGSIVLEAGGMFSNPRWNAGSLKNLAGWLDAHTGLRAATDALVWEWEQGFTKIELEWTVQARPLGDGHTHVVLKAGRYGGFTTYEVGFARFLDLCARLAPELPAEPSARQEMLRPSSFGALLGLVHDGEREPDSEHAPAHPPAASTVPVDFSPALRAILGPLQGKKVHLDSIPEKKERNAREHVLPPAARTAPIVALVDLTTFGSAKDAIVLTPTHLYAKEIDDRAAFPLADLVAVTREPGIGHTHVEVEVRGLGTVHVPTGLVDEVVTALLKGIVAGAP